MPTGRAPAKPVSAKIAGSACQLRTFRALDAMNQQMPKNLLGLDLEELAAMVGAAGEPAYRAQQIFHALYSERVPSLDEATSLSKEFRAALGAAGVSVGMPSIQKRFLSSDGTVRYLIELSDSETVETVWMSAGDGGEIWAGSEGGAVIACE